MARRLPFLLCCAGGGAAEYQSRQVQYGKYWTYYMGVQSYEANTYYLYSPANASAGAQLPIVIEFHGGGFTGGSPAKILGPDQQAFLDQGMHYLSADYRLVADKHYYGDASAPKEHEFIHAYPNGTLAVDTTGKVMSDYKVHVGRTEFNTMCSYDAAAVLEHLIAHAGEYGVDVHRIGFTGGSAGGGEINYLTWVYHALHPERYTPVSMHYTMAQLDYPVENMVVPADGSGGGPWNLWADDVGSDTKLAKILSQGDCKMIVGNQWCDKQGLEVDLCNATWNQEGLDRFCGDTFADVTLGELVKARTFPMDTDQDKGIWRLWSTSQNMLRHQPKGSAPGGKFHLLVSNALNSTAGMEVVHNALYARNYARYAERAGGINYAVYYTDYEGMTEADKGAERFAAAGRGGPVVYNYRSNFGWVDLPGVRALGRSSLPEFVRFHCHAMGLPCSSTPAPAPPPGPGGVSAACAAAIDTTCPSARSAADCTACARTNAGPFIAAGCPTPGEGGLAACVAYCESRA